ncbi:single-stranded-DNA-specific exonuclease [Alteromonadaceae bacterium 2753L.S.0a.02]|nr:single-stranded-DNA-specific exonuclease [Alteromonadaceae bacterium 2753L.S.0a.02]
MHIIKKTIRQRTATTETSSQLNHFAPLVRRVLANRGVSDPSQIDYQLRNLLQPSQMSGLQEAVVLLERMLKQRGRICILGDFDADGATSTALAVQCLKAFGFSSVEFLVPNRFEFGYGLTPEIVAVIATLKPSLIITVDNGIASFDGVAAAHALGIQVLITDHHLPAEQLPPAEVIVNPNQPGCGFPSKNLAGVGVIFYVMNALRAHLRETAWFQSSGVTEPNMAQFLDLVALGTVADVVPLDQNNRTLVEQGLKRIRAGRARPGIRALFEVGRRALERLTATDLGFVAGPRLNAAGRLDDMSLGIRCLLAESEHEARLLATQLDELNRERRAIELSMQREAITYLDKVLESQTQWPQAICLYQEDWHQGVIGILASRIKDRLHRPTIVFAEADDENLKGSGRSIPGVHLRDLLDAIATRHSGLLSKFGGHAMAAGLSLRKADLERFMAAFESEADRLLNGEAPEAEIVTDGEVDESAYTLDTARLLAQLGPWGQAFPEPCFDGRFRIVNQRIVGEKHLKLVVTPADYSGLAIDAIAFNVDTEIWPNPSLQWVRLAFTLNVNEYRGEESLQLMVSYLEPLVAQYQAD